MKGNATIVRGIYEAFARSDMDAVLGALAPHVRWIEAEGFPYGGIYVGPEAVVDNVLTKLGSEWESFTAVPYDFISEGNTVVALGEYQGVYKATGKRFAAPFAHAWRLEGGKVAMFQQYTDTAIAQAATR